MSNNTAFLSGCVVGIAAVIGGGIGVIVSKLNVIIGLLEILK